MFGLIWPSFMSDTRQRVTFDDISRHRNQARYHHCCAYTPLRLTPIATLIRKQPSGNTSDDLNKVRRLLVTSLGKNLELDIETLNSLLDGTSTGSTTQERISAIHNALLITPTSVLRTDLATVRALLVSTPGSTLENDILTLNKIIDSAAPISVTRSMTKSTTQSKLGDLGSAPSIFAMIGIKDPISITSALGNTNGDSNSIASLLSSTPGSSIYEMIIGSDGLLSKIDGITGDDSDVNIDSRLTTQIQSLKSSSTQLSTAINDVNSLIGGSSDTTHNRISTLNISIDGVSMSGLTTFTFINRAASLGAEVLIQGNDGSGINIYSLDTATISLGSGTDQTSPILNGGSFTLTGPNGKTITFMNNSDNAITSATALDDYLATTYPIGSVLTASSTSKIFVIKNMLGGNKSCLLSCVTNIASIIGGNRSADITSQLGDPGTGSTIIDKLDNSQPSVVSAINALSTKLVGNTAYSSSLCDRVTTINNEIDNGLISLPNSAPYAIVSSISSDGDGGVNIIIVDNEIGGSIEGSYSYSYFYAYNLPKSTIESGISSGENFALTNGVNSIVLSNQSGATISTQSDALKYLKSMYPTGSKLSTCLTDSISALKVGLGGNQSAVRTRLAMIDSSLLTNPTGVLSADLVSARDLLVGTRNATMQDDIESLNTLLDGRTSGSTTTQARIGAPTINGSSSDVMAVIGGTESDIASRLGDPVTGSSGLSALIKASTALNNNGVDISNFTNAQNIHAQLTAFLALCQQGCVFEDTTGVDSLADLISIAKPLP